MKLIIEDDEGHRTVVPFVRDEITIGRQEGNTIRLTERNVSRKHARLVRDNGFVMVEDVGSAYGIHVNGERVREPVPVKDGDLIQIGDYDLAIQQDGASEPTAIRPRPTESDDDEEGLSAEPAEDTATDDDPSRHPTAQIPVEITRPAEAAAIAPELAPRLVVLNTALSGREFACIRTELRIGRTDDNDITIDHDSLAPTHATLRCGSDGAWLLVVHPSVGALKVNDESCGRADLAHGDQIALGEVMLQFVGAGQSFRRSAIKGKKSGSGKAVLLVALVVLGGGGFAGWHFRDRLMGTPVPAHPAPAPQPVAVDTPPPPPSEPPASATPTDNELIAQAKKANDAKDFDHAIELLDRIQGASVDEAAQAKSLRAVAEKEQAARKALDAAKDDLAAGNPAQAQKDLARAIGTQAFARELSELEHQVKTAPRPKAPPPAAPKAPAHPAAEVVDASAIYDQGKTLLRGSQFREAATTFGQCLEVDPKHAKCHMLLGASLAQLASSNPDPHGRNGQLDQAALHYRKFLELAGPDDAREVEKVKQILKSYEAQRQP